MLWHGRHQCSCSHLAQWLLDAGEFASLRHASGETRFMQWQHLELAFGRDGVNREVGIGTAAKTLGTFIACLRTIGI